MTILHVHAGVDCLNCEGSASHVHAASLQQPIPAPISPIVAYRLSPLLDRILALVSGGLWLVHSFAEAPHGTVQDAPVSLDLLFQIDHRCSRYCLWIHPYIDVLRPIPAEYIAYGLDANHRQRASLIIVCFQDDTMPIVNTDHIAAPQAG